MKIHGNTRDAAHPKLYGFDIFFFCYLFLESVLIALHGAGIADWAALLKKNSIIMLLWFFFWTVGEYRRKGFFWFVRNCYLCAALPILFTEVKYIIHLVNPVDLDPVLSKIDHAIFSVHPGLWMEQYLHPWLTTFFQLLSVKFKLS